MSILSAQSIRTLCEQKIPLIEPCDEARIKGSSYDLSLGTEYYLYKRKVENKKVENMIEKIEIGQELEIPSREICFVITREKVNIPNNIAARVSLMTDLIMRGVVITTQPPIDPGYKGKIYALLHNLSNKAVHLKSGNPILTIEFNKLDIETDKPYDERLQDLATLKKQNSGTALSPFMTVIDSGMRELEDELTSTRERFQNVTPIILMSITVIVGILTIAVAVWVGLTWFN